MLLTSGSKPTEPLHLDTYTYRPEMLLHTGPKVKMKIAFTNKERVRRSPFYLCNALWDNLDSKIQVAKNVIEFKNILSKMDLTGL